MNILQHHKNKACAIFAIFIALITSAALVAQDSRESSNASIQSIPHTLDASSAPGTSGTAESKDLLDPISKRLRFPSEYKSGVMYASIKRGGVIEDIYAPRADIEELQKSGKLPDLATITMEEFASDNGARGQKRRYIIMQKRGNQWRFEAFNADKSLNAREDTARCLNCHANSISSEDIVFTLESMRDFKLR